MKKIDLRSDTVTQPSDDMRAVIAAAPVGDDVYGEDPTVNKLQTYAAELLRKEAALYCPSGTQSNLVGLLAHCERGDEYIVGNAAHTYLYEGGGAAVLGSIQPQTLDLNADASMDLDKVRRLIKPKDVHYARTKLIALENTHNGRCMPIDHPSAVRALADEYDLSMHLDGARLFNAVVKQGANVKDLVQHFDTVSICLSKGLGAPMGSLLVGRADLIEKATRWRKVVGGGMRQVGMMAAAGLYALKNNISRLADDHANAQALAEGLRAIEGVSVDMAMVETNMVYVTVTKEHRTRLEPLAAAEGIVLPAGTTMRLVTHMDVSAADIGRVISLFQK